MNHWFLTFLAKVFQYVKIEAVTGLQLRRYYLTWFLLSCYIIQYSFLSSSNQTSEWKEILWIPRILRVSSVKCSAQLKIQLDKWAARCGGSWRQRDSKSFITGGSVIFVWRLYQFRRAIFYASRGTRRVSAKLRPHSIFCFMCVTARFLVRV